MTSFSQNTEAAIPVLHIVPKLTSVGGVGNQLLNLLRHYDRKAIRPIVCSLREKGDVGIEMEALGVEVIALGHDFRKGFYPGLVKRLSAMIRERSVKVVRTHEYRATLHGVPAAYWAGTPCIVPSVHNVYTPRDRKLNRRLTNRALSHLADRIVAVSGAVKNDVIACDRVPAEKIRVIHNGVDVRSFAAAERSSGRELLGLRADVPVIGTVGRLFPQKGHRHLIEAASLLKDGFPDLKVLFVGDGPLKEELAECAAKNNVGEMVLFAGARRDVALMLAAMDVFVFPSLWEGFGNALIEAMAAGLPIVASDIPAVLEILPDREIGRIVPPGDGRAIADAVRTLLTEKGLAGRLGGLARERALASFTIEKTAENYSALYREILTAKHACEGACRP